MGSYNGNGGRVLLVGASLRFNSFWHVRHLATVLGQQIGKLVTTKFYAGQWCFLREYLQVLWRSCQAWPPLDLFYASEKLGILVSLFFKKKCTFISVIETSLLPVIVGSLISFLSSRQNTALTGF